MKRTRISKILSFTSYSTFWGWNIAFLLLVVIGIMPSFGRIIDDAMSSALPLDFPVSILLLILVPAISILVARKKFNGRPDLQIRLFYGVEAPIFLLCLMRLFIMRELTSGSAFLIMSILLSSSIYFRNLLNSNKPELPCNKINALINGFLLVMAIYIGSITILYALPMGFFLLKLFFELLRTISELSFNDSLEKLRLLLVYLTTSFWWLPFTVIVFYFSVALFVFLPIAIVKFYTETWICMWNNQEKQSTRNMILGTTGAIIAVWIAFFVLADHQPQTKAFDVLAKPAATQSEKKLIVDEASDIRKGLLNAYLYPYRYLGTNSKTIIENFYSIFYESLNTKPIEKFHNTLISPLLYKGEHSDIKKAADLYASVFDTSIQKGEQASIIKALTATFDRDQVEAGLLDINQEKVLMAEQHVTVSQEDSLSNVEIYEVYENKTFTPAEIFYYFSLPENSSITGLWLGESPDKDKRQSYTVSPRGAAQKVYKEQVKERIDPALLEQVGPRQYRLRAFPIPSKNFERKNNRLFDSGFNESPKSEQPKMHLWLTYSVINDGSSPVLPQLLEKRNIYWNDKTKRWFNGSEASTTNAWMPDSENYLQGINQTISVPFKEDGYLVTAQKVNEELLKPVFDKKFAILIDTSYSMNEKIEAIHNNIRRLQQQNNPENIDIFIHPVGEKLTKVSLQDLSNTTFFGSISNSELWNQSVSIQKQGHYDVVFVLSDQGSYDLEHDKPQLLDSASPVWFVHMDKLSPAYEDKFMHKLLASHGGVTVDLYTAYQQFIVQDKLSPTQRLHGMIVWNFSKDLLEANLTQNNKNSVAAKMLIDYMASLQKDNATKLLDDIHKIAKRESVVSPYSSMIVLVNDAQKEVLKKAEQEIDRFDRVVDTGIENLTTPSMISGVPEPEIWLLIGISALFLMLLANTNRLKAGGLLITKQMTDK